MGGNSIGAASVGAGERNLSGSHRGAKGSSPPAPSRALGVLSPDKPSQVQAVIQPRG